jgi:hypothetical protein
MSPEAFKRRKRAQQTWVIKGVTAADHPTVAISSLCIDGRKFIVVKELRNGSLICREDI